MTAARVAPALCSQPLAHWDSLAGAAATVAELTLTYRVPAAGPIVVDSPRTADMPRR